MRDVAVLEQSTGPRRSPVPGLRRHSPASSLPELEEVLKVIVTLRTFPPIPDEPDTVPEDPDLEPTLPKEPDVEPPPIDIPRQLPEPQR